MSKLSLKPPSWIGPTRPVDLPTGSGIITLPLAMVNAGSKEPQVATDWAAAHGYTTVTVPAGDYPITPNFTVNNSPFELDKRLSLIGCGSQYSRFWASGTIVMDETLIGISSGSTNPFYLMRTEGGGTTSGKTYQGWSINNDNLQPLDAAWGRVRKSNTAYTVGQIIRPTTPQGSLYVCITAGTTQNAAPFTAGNFPSTYHATYTDGTAHFENVGVALFGGARFHQIDNSLMQDVVTHSIGGSSNTPPGEIFNLNLWNCNNWAINDVYNYGDHLAGCLCGVNGGGGHVFNRGGGFDSGHSHGYSMYQTSNITFNSVISRGHGSGTGSSGAAGFNNEDCIAGAKLIYNNCIADVGNPLASWRFEAGAAGGVNELGHQLNNCVAAGSRYGVWCQSLQTTLPTITGGSITGSTSSTHIGA